VDTANMTKIMGYGWDERMSRSYYSLATGWFHPSVLEGTTFPSAHFLSSSHHGVVTPSALALSIISTHFAVFSLRRELIQSIVLFARSSSSSWQASSISVRSENLSAN